MMNIKRTFAFISVMLLAGQAYAYNCSGVAQYSDSASYNTNAVVQRNGTAYRCTVGGWCTTGGPYAPGSGWAWEHAWSNLGSCGSTGGSSSSTSSTSSSTSSTTTGGSCANWAAGTWYAAGAKVRFNGSQYIAKHGNPGYSPVESTWFWDPIPASSCGGTSSSSSSTSTGGTCPNWVAGAWYPVGSKVNYNGSSYIAEHANPGYNPVESHWFWKPTASCGGGSSSSTSSSSSSIAGNGFSAIVSEAQFNQMFPNRNPFYTYRGLVDAAGKFPAFANTGSLDVRKREAAAALANFSHETSGLIYIEEIQKADYCGDWGNAATCPCAPGKQYFGRGPMQLSWNGNYCALGAVLGLDLRANPDLVAQNATVAWSAAIWFWMTSTGAGNRTAHTAMTSGAGFGETIRTINGALECNGGQPAKVQSRINLYQNYIQRLGGTPGNNLSC